MSSVPGPIDASLLQTAQAQQVAAKARDRQKADAERSRQIRDLVELRVLGVEAPDAIRRLPANDSEQAEEEHRERERGDGRIDLRA